MMAWVEIACVASVSVEFSALKSRFSYFWTRAKWGENEKREGAPPLPSPPPPCFCSRPISRASKTTKIVFLAKNATVTLATQARVESNFPTIVGMFGVFGGTLNAIIANVPQTFPQSLGQILSTLG